MRAPTAAPPPHRCLSYGLLACVLAAGTLAAQQRPTGRIMGVFDELSFQPVVSAEVIDLRTGTKALTTATGTISLAWLDPGSTVLQVRKLGYRTRSVIVAVSPTDTGSVTTVLAPLATTLPAVLTTAGPTPDEPRWKRGLVGFDERQRSTGAPPSAFVTSEQIAKWNLTLLSDLKYHTGRSVCGDVFIDGVHTDMSAMALGSNYKSGIDELLRPENVAGIEIYSEAEAPYPYYQPQPPPVTTRVGGRIVSTRGGGIKSAPKNFRCAVTLIWTK